MAISMAFCSPVEQAAAGWSLRGHGDRELVAVRAGQGALGGAVAAAAFAQGAASSACMIGPPGT